MTDRFSEDDVIAAIARLTRVELVGFIEAEFIRPERGGGGYVFRQIDIARLELLCDLSHDLDLDETALGVVLTLIDKLHAERQERAAIENALNTLSDDLRAQIITAMARD